MWRSVYATWNHPEFKLAWYILTMQIWSLFTTAGLIWSSIQHAKVLLDATQHPLQVSALMIAVSDFYNIVSGCEAKNDILMTCVVIQIIWLSRCYDKECLAQE